MRTLSNLARGAGSAIFASLLIVVASHASAQSADAPKPDESESAARPAKLGEGGEWQWVPYNLGGETATKGWLIAGHLGGGLRLGDGPFGDPHGRGGFRLGLSGLYRFNRIIGLGLGYEHADLHRDRVDSTNATFTDIFRDLNTLWVFGRATWFRSDPISLYLDLGLGPSWQSLDTSSINVAGGNAGVAITQNNCEGSGKVALATRLNVGAELGLAKGLVFWGDVGADYYHLSDDVLSGCTKGAGKGVTLGFRLGLAFGKEWAQVVVGKEAPKDKDGDSILDGEDACVDVPGVASDDPAKNGCPADKDGDKILDKDDACVDQPGKANADPKKHGCPPPGDKDGDDVPDDVDACPEIPGVKTADPKTNGCPGDTDGDGIRDDEDACPKEKGEADPDPKKNGCPKQLVQVTDKEIVILEQVQFDIGLTTIKPVSNALLDSVAKVVKEHPEILKLEVQGHTDNTGPAALNKTLSQGRADAVRKALETRGVEGKRLVSKGYGPDKPIGDNATTEGKTKNRRVQFVILEKAEKPKP